MNRERVRRFLRPVILAAVYLALGKIGLSVVPVSRFATVVWAPSGVSLAALAMYGLRLWPGVALGAFLVNLWVGAPILVALAIATGNTLEAVLGAAALRRATGGDMSLSRVHDALALIVFAALSSTTVSATVGLLSLLAGGLIPSGQVFATWRSWYVGDMVSDLVVAPALLCAAPRRLLGDRWNPVTAAVLSAAVLFTAVFVFWGLPVGPQMALRRTYVTFPFIVLAALRFGPWGSATTTLLVSAVAVVSTTVGRGPFQGPGVHESLLDLHAYMAIVAATSLILGSAIAERGHAERALREARDELESRVELRTAELTYREAQLKEAQRMAQLGSWEWDIRTNRLSWSEELCRIYGITPEQFGGTYESFLAHVRPRERTLVEQSLERSIRDRVPLDLEHGIVRPDGTERLLQTRGQVRLDAGGDPSRLTGTSLDVTVAKQRELELEASLAEKEVLFREMHHRVKNNLQIVSSLLSLQQGSLDDPLVRGALSDCQSRVRSIALVHEKLHASREATDLDLDEFLQSLVKGLFQVYGMSSKVEVDIDTHECTFALDTGIPCGMIVNELVSNSLKHAFPEGRRGHITVNMHREPDGRHCVLDVADDGIGLPPDVDPKNPRTLGLRLVGSLTEQLGGSFEAITDGGTRFRIRFPAAPRAEDQAA